MTAGQEPEPRSGQRLQQGCRGVRSPLGTGSDKATRGTVGALAWGRRAVGPSGLCRQLARWCSASLFLSLGWPVSRAAQPMRSQSPCGLRWVPSWPPQLALCFEGRCAPLLVGSAFSAGQGEALRLRSSPLLSLQPSAAGPREGPP